MLCWAEHTMQGLNSTENGAGTESSRKKIIGKTKIEMERYSSKGCSRIRRQSKLEGFGDK